MRGEDRRLTRMLGWMMQYGQATPPEGSFASVSAGWVPHLRSEDRRLTSNAGVMMHYGQATPPEGSFASVSAGGYHTCGVKTDGSRRMLGVQQGSVRRCCWSGHATRRFLRLGQRRAQKHLRSEARWLCRVLG